MSSGDQDEWFVVNSDDVTSFAQLKSLLGYRVKYKSHGRHAHDGQVVDYTFYFVSPSGEQTKIKTDMCLQTGWNHNSEEIIK